MAVYKDKWNGYKGDTWRVAVYYKDWKEIRRKHEKRGFATKKEALAYEREYIAKTSKDTNMGFDTFVDIYMSDIKPQIKLSTYVTKENIINAHICSYFENKSLSEITANDILQWQNALLSLRDDDGKGYSQTYLRTIQNQLNAIFNHAVKYYDSPVQIAERLGHESVTITERYSHLYPSVQKDMAKKLDTVFKEEDNND